MANDDYLVKLGIDGNELLKGLNTTIDGLEKTEKAATDTGKEIEQAFTKANKASEDLDKNIQKPVKNIKELNNVTKTLNSTLEATEKAGAGVGKNVAKSANDYNKALRGSSSVTMEFNRIIQDAPFGMMGISNNLTQLVDNFGAYKKSLTASAAEQGKTISGFTALKGAVTGILSPINLIPLGVAAATSAWIAYTNWQQKAKKEKEALTKTSKEYIETLEGEKRAYADSLIQISSETSNLRVLYTATQNQTLAMKDRLTAARLLKEEFPDTFANLTNEAIVAGQAAGAYDRLAASIIASARASAYRKSIEDNEKRIINLMLKNEAEQERIDKLKSDRLKQQIKDQQNQNEYVKAYTTLNKDGLADVNTEVKKITSNYKWYDEAVKSGNDNLKKSNDEIEKLNKQNEKFAQNAFTGSEAIIADDKKTKAELAKSAKSAKAAADKALKEQLELNKEINTQTIQYVRQLEDSKLSLMVDGLDKQKALVNKEFYRKIQDLENEKSLTADNEAKKTEIINALNEERNKKILETEKAFENQRLQLQLEAQKTIENYKKANLENDLKLLDITYQSTLIKIREQYKDEQDLLIELEATLLQNVNDEKQKIRNDYGKKDLEEQEKLAILSVEMMSKYAVQNEKTEQQKQLAILAVKLDFAQKNLDLLEATGGDENKVQIAQAKKIIQDLKNEINKEAKNGKGFDFLEFIGLGDLSSEQKKAVMDAAKELYEGIKQITDAIISQYDRQIDKKQETIDQIDEEIGELEESLDREKELRDQGFANNVEAIEAEIAEKERQKQEEIRQQEELLEQKKKMQKAQLAIDTAIQLTNLITASTNIFNALSSIPFVGIPLAIATIGVMFGAFAVTKAKAAQSINDQKLEKGGWIKGKRHSEGGVKIGLGYEAEDGEFVTNRKTASKYPKFLEAMNENKLSSFDIGSQELGMLLNELGIDLSSPETIEAVQEQKTIDLKLPEKGSNEDFTEMNGNLRFLAEREKMKEEHWEDKYFYYKRKGNRITKIRK